MFCIKGETSSRNKKGHSFSFYSTSTLDINMQYFIKDTRGGATKCVYALFKNLQNFNKILIFICI